MSLLNFWIHSPYKYGSGNTGKLKLRGGGGPFDSGFSFIFSMNRLMEDTTWWYISWNSSLVT
jgi:hypothetical protein